MSKFSPLPFQGEVLTKLSLEAVGVYGLRHYRSKAEVLAKLSLEAVGVYGLRHYRSRAEVLTK